MAQFALGHACQAGPGGGYQCCGNFCGPGWCGSRFVPEGPRCNLNGAVAPRHRLFGGPVGRPSATDTCCRSHDFCCGMRADQSQCNAELRRCFGWSGVANTVNGGSDCTRRGVPMAGEVILAMTTVWALRWCCGSPCPATAKLPVYTIWYLAAWYVCFIVAIAYIQLRGHANPKRKRLRTMMGLRSVMFLPEGAQSAPNLETEMSRRLPGSPSARSPGASDKSDAKSDGASGGGQAIDDAPAAAATQTVWRLAWPWATPVFLVLVSWTQILLLWTIGEDDSPTRLGVLTPDPRPSAERLQQLVLGLNASNVSSFLEAAPMAVASFTQMNDAQYDEMQAARAPARWLSYMFVHASVVHLVNNLALQLGSGVCMEMLHGSGRTGAIYVVSGLSASLAFTAFPRDHFTLLAGGSASCFGIVGAQLANCVLNWAQMPYAPPPSSTHTHIRAHLVARPSCLLAASARSGS